MSLTDIIMVKENCYWYSKETNDPSYCEYDKKYIDECEEECNKFISKQLADGAMRIVVNRRIKNNGI